jgi:hypothetical protein
MDIQKIIDFLELLKPEHYSEPSGIMSCMSVDHPDMDCDCGADKVIEQVDQFIAELKNYRLEKTNP